jgi:hypothetical protein
MRGDARSDQRSRQFVERLDFENSHSSVAQCLVLYDLGLELVKLALRPFAHRLANSGMDL